MIKESSIFSDKVEEPKKFLKTIEIVLDESEDDAPMLKCSVDGYDKLISILNFRNYYFTSLKVTYRSSGNGQCPPNKYNYEHFEEVIKEIIRNQYDIEVSEISDASDLVKQFKEETLRYYQGVYSHDETKLSN